MRSILTNTSYNIKGYMRSCLNPYDNNIYILTFYFRIHYMNNVIYESYHVNVTFLNLAVYTLTHLRRTHISITPTIAGKDLQVGMANCKNTYFIFNFI